MGNFVLKLIFQISFKRVRKLNKQCSQRTFTSCQKFLVSQKLHEVSENIRGHFHKTLISLVINTILYHKEIENFHKVSRTVKTKPQEVFFTCQTGKGEKNKHMKINSICVHGGKKAILSPSNEDRIFYDLSGERFEKIHMKRHKFFFFFLPKFRANNPTSRNVLQGNNHNYTQEVLQQGRPLQNLKSKNVETTSLSILESRFQLDKSMRWD